MSVAPTTHTDQMAAMSEVAAAVRRRTVLSGHTDETVYLVAHHAPWRIYHDHHLGWVARRVDRDRRDIPGATGWLGCCDLDPGQVVDNLLRLPHLAAASSSHRRWLATHHPWNNPEQPWYVRCPYPMRYRDITTGGCGANGGVTPGEIPAPPVDLDVSVPVTCRLCQHTFDGRPQAVPATSSVDCPRCQVPVPAPVEAIHHRCRACGWWFFDPTLPTHRQAQLARLVDAGPRPVPGVEE